MKIIWKPQSLIEWIGVKLNMMPAPTGAMLYGYMCKVILLAEKYNIFEA